MTKLYLRLIENIEREEGQGLVEYVALIIGVAAMVTTVVAAITGTLQSVVTTALSGLSLG